MHVLHDALAFQRQRAFAVGNLQLCVVVGRLQFARLDRGCQLLRIARHARLIGEHTAAQLQAEGDGDAETGNRVQGE